MVISTWKRFSELAGRVMIGLGQVQDFCAVAGVIRDSAALSDLMAEITKAMGFRHYALVHHVDLKPAVSSVHVVDYPPDWVERFQARRLYASDPIHRASHRTNVGFAWSAVQSLITLSAADRSILAEAHDAGLGDGFTVPAHIPGEVNGSCSFAMGAGDVLDQRQLPLVQLIGSFAFEAARRLSRQTLAPCEGPSLTERQAECVALVARGKTDWEISQNLRHWAGNGDPACKGCARPLRRDEAHAAGDPRIVRWTDQLRRCFRPMISPGLGITERTRA